MGALEALEKMTGKKVSPRRKKESLVPGKDMMLKRHWQRSQRARDIDHELAAEHTFTPQDKEGRVKWYRHPNRYDMRGLDDPAAEEYYQTPHWQDYRAAVRQKMKTPRGGSKHREMQRRMSSDVYEKQMINRITSTTSLNYMQVKHLINMDTQDKIGDIETEIKEGAAGYSRPKEAYEHAKSRIDAELRVERILEIQGWWTTSTMTMLNVAPMGPMTTVHTRRRRGGHGGQLYSFLIRSSPAAIN